MRITRHDLFPRAVALERFYYRRVNGIGSGDLIAPRNGCDPYIPLFEIASPERNERTRGCACENPHASRDASRVWSSIKLNHGRGSKKRLWITDAAAIRDGYAGETEREREGGEAPGTSRRERWHTASLVFVPRRADDVSGCSLYNARRS